MPTNVDDDACQIDSKAGTMLWRLLLIYQQYSQQSLLPAKHPVAKNGILLPKLFWPALRKQCLSSNIEG